MASRKKQAMVVTLSGDRPAHEVAHDLKAAGFEVGQVLDIVGSVTGSADPKLKKKLEGIRGVAHVGKDYPVSTASGDAPSI
jgi:hypothetical protein